MKTLLHVSTSPRGERSRSNQVGATYLAQWQAAHPEGRVVTRDLAAEPPSFVNSAWFEGAFTAPEGHSPAARTAMAESDHNIDQLFAADEIVITTPMFNLNLPAVLKAWIDQVVRAGRTFTIDENGYKGLTSDRKVTIIVATGGDFRPGSPAVGYNFLEPYLRGVLGFIGLTSLTFVYAANQSGGEEAATKGVADAKAEAETLAAA
ncbi:FMN-dependent NADH-azoreductase [Synoicihabitans lomoniglobus]|uniref:FMN dependent NADH:quinone oxidoreductase n=1 Tax=Synoicihabitans lomoniglobus TaxID=2909285 RepID=A0AAE9ZVF2_9BACT|nr:NAD(P)H-dependent oxidoreductase [Opitutaceae bacterium LMO-M01]WED64861.1 NAD(P)H-dependent oxidoreductase [Opitutaceae bacterium LMO-M01]